jgi:DNA polymerase-3 subunit epsilon
MEFVAIDVETANADLASICQIGVARFQNGTLVEEWKSLVQPSGYFDPINVSIHGIDESTVEGAPSFSELSPVLDGFLNDRVVVSHSHFDRSALRKSFEKYSIPMPRSNWLDSVRIARRAWSESAASGYGLAAVCERIGYAFTHHDALEDAKACGHIVVAAMAVTGLDLNGWLLRVTQPITQSAEGAVARVGNPDGALFGEILVFTGALKIPRKTAADMAAKAGCKVDGGVTKETTMLIVGDQDIRQLAGQEKSSKHRKAEELISKGQKIRILMESDFKEIVGAAAS